METEIRIIRKSRNLTLAQASRQLGTDPGNLSRIERGVQEPSVDLARKLASFYGVSMDLIYGANGGQAA